MSVEEDLYDDGDDEGNDEGTDITILSAEVESESGDDSVDKANEEIAQQSTSKEVFSNKLVTLGKHSVYFGESSTPPSTSSRPPELESDSIRSLLSRLTAAIEKERKEHLTETNNCE